MDDVNYSSIEALCLQMEKTGMAFVYDTSKTIVFWTNILFLFVLIVKYGYVTFMWAYTMNDLKPLGEKYLIDDAKNADLKKRHHEQVEYDTILKLRRRTKNKKESSIQNWFTEILRCIFGIEAAQPLLKPRYKDLRKFRNLNTKEPLKEPTDNILCTQCKQVL